MKNAITLMLPLALAMSAGAQDVVLSLDAPASLGGTTYADENFIAHVGPSTYADHQASLAAALPLGADVDAVDYIDPTSVYFSLDIPANLSGAGLVADEDVIHWNGSTFTLAWDGSANGLPDSADIDALDVVSEGPLVFDISLDAPAVITGPGSVQDEDVITWNGSSFDVGLAFLGSLEGVPQGLDLDAFNRRNVNEYAISFDGPSTIDGVAFDDEDLVVFNTSTVQFTGLLYDGSAEGLLASADLDGAEATPGQVPVELSVFSAE